MRNFLTFLGEAWPPSKNGPPQGKQKSPFGNSAGPKKSKPSFGEQGTPSKGLTPEHPSKPAKQPPFGPKSPQEDGKKPSFGQPGQEDGAGPNGAFGQQGPMDAEAIRAQQEIEQQQAEMEAELQRQKLEQDAMERQKVKNMRAQADADVMSALEDKYNDDTDYVEFYPDMLTFSQYNDEQKEKEAKLRGASPSTPLTSTTVASGSGAAVGSQMSSDHEIGDKGETPKVPDAKKSKEDLKKKKIVGTESDDTESLSQPPVSDEEAEEGDEHQVEKTPQKEKELAQGNSQMLGQGERKIFKIKPADHVSGNEFVGQGEFEDELENGEEDEEVEEGESEGSPFGGKSKSKNENPFGKKDKGNDEGAEDEDEEEVKPKVKSFKEFGKK